MHAESSCPREWTGAFQSSKRSERKDAPHMNRPIAAAGWPRAWFYIVQFTWGLPVNLVGLLVFLCCKSFVSEKFCNSVVTYLPGNRGGLSLGVFLFLSVQSEHERSGLCVHEYGHTIQCLFLGPLYWPVIAIPSAVWYHFFAGFRKRRQIAYDALYCERWADIWGTKWSGTRK